MSTARVGHRCEEDRTLRAVLVEMLRESERRPETRRARAARRDGSLGRSRRVDDEPTAGTGDLRVEL